MKLRLSFEDNKLDLLIRLSKSKTTECNVFFCIPEQSAIVNSDYIHEEFYNNITSSYSYHISKVKAPLLSRLLRDSESKYDLPLFVKRYKIYINDILLKLDPNKEDILPIIIEIELLLSTLRRLETKGGLRKLFRDSDEICTFYTEQKLLSYLTNNNISITLEGVLNEFILKQKSYRIERYGNSELDRTVSKIRRKEKNLFKFIELNRKSITLGKAREHMVFSLSAFLSMLITTAVVFYFQNDYGSLSFNVFMALCLSYIFKDRFKEVFRSEVLNRVNKGKDQKKVLLSDTNGKLVGTVYEMVQTSKLNLKSRIIRNKGSSVKYNESVIHYRKRYVINDKAIDVSSHIINKETFHIESIISKFPSKVMKYYHYDNNAISSKVIDELYELNIIISINKEKLVRYKIITSPSEIKDCIKIC